MSTYFPHAPYAEDQPLAHTVLYTHVITRTVTFNTILATGITTARHLIPYFRPKVPLPFTTGLLLSCSRATLIALPLGALMTAGRMWGREEIEWQDRSWRLLENLGQMETDGWTYSSMAVGAAVGAVKVGGWKGAVGGAGLGSFAGMVGYMAWRYGVNGGKFPGVLKEEKEILK